MTGNDTFTGVLQANGASGTTIQPGDAINGGAGTDTLNISVAGSGGGAFSISAVSTSSVEKVLLSNFDTHAGDTTVAATLMTGVTTVGLSSSGADGDTVFNGLQNFVAAEMRNGAADLTLTYDGAQVVSGTADSQALTVSSLTAGGFLSNGIETIAITSELSKSTLASLASDALKTVTVTGAADLTITAALNFASNGTATAPGAVVNASTFTGKLNITTTANEVLSVTGGSGDDTFTLGSLTKDDVIAGGAGDDTINMAAVALADKFTKVSGIETVAFTASTGTVAMDVSKLSAGVTTVQVDHADGTNNTAADTLTISNLDGQTVKIKHTVADAGTDANGDGANITITGKTDTSADIVNVILDAVSGISGGTGGLGVATLNVANYETVNLTSSKSTTVTANTVNTLTATTAKSVNVTGDADLTITAVGGGAMTSLNASALAGKFVATLAGDKVAVTLGQKDSTINFGSTLNNDDTVTGGAGKDTLTASVSGLTATTGALKVAGVETITLTTAADNTLDLAAVTGATQVSVSTAVQTITGLNLATKLVATADAASLKVTAATATGTNDTLTVEQKLDGAATTTITAAAEIENLSLILNDTGATVQLATFALAEFAGKTVTVAESATTTTTGQNAALGTLNKSITSVDTSGVKGTQAFSVTSSTVGTTLNLAGAAVATVTGSEFADTINVASTGAVIHVINGGGGTDIMNIAVKNGFADAGSITNVETMNVTALAGDAVTLTTGFATGVKTLNLLGGNSINVFTTATVRDEMTVLNAGAFGGAIAATIADDKFDDTLTITAGALTTDAVTAKFATAGTYKGKTTGVETLKITADKGDTAAAAFVFSLENTTGVSKIEVTVGDQDSLAITKMAASGTTIIVKATDTTTAAPTVEAILADATGAADAVSFELSKVTDAASIADTTILKTTDIETINLKIGGNAETITLASLGMTDATKFASLVVTGDQALTASAVNAAVNTINASGMTTGGSFIQGGRSTTTAVNYIGSLGNDTFIMAHGNDAINAAAGTGDSLVVTGNYILGGIQVDLSATGDQITTFNGSANAAIQTGFENIDFSAITGSAQADITAIKTGSTIAGTKNADQITGGAGVDTIVIAGDVANSDVMTGGASTDILSITSGTATFATDGNLVTFETVNLGTTASVDLTNQTEAFTINGGTGVNNITGGGGADIILGGTGADAMNGGAAADTFIIRIGDSSGITSTNIANPGALAADEVFTHAAIDKITGFATGDKIQFQKADGTALTFATTVLTTGGTIAGATGSVVMARGTQTNATTFTTAAGADTIVFFDIDGTGANAVYQAVILVGYTGLANDTITAGGLLTAV